MLWRTQCVHEFLSPSPHFFLIFSIFLNELEFGSRHSILSFIHDQFGLIKRRVWFAELETLSGGETSLHYQTLSLGYKLRRVKKKRGANLAWQPLCRSQLFHDETLSATSENRVSCVIYKIDLHIIQTIDIFQREFGYFECLRCNMRGCF